MSTAVTLAQLETRNTLQHPQTAQDRLREAQKTLDGLEPVLRSAIKTGDRRDGAASLAAAACIDTTGQDRAAVNKPAAIREQASQAPGGQR